MEPEKRGQVVRMFMADGTVTGIREIEILTRTLHAFAVQRERLADLKGWPDANRPGVYFLFGETPEEKHKAYIGEAQKVVDRVIYHVREGQKEFWTRSNFFRCEG